MGKYHNSFSLTGICLLQLKDKRNEVATDKNK